MPHTKSSLSLSESSAVGSLENQDHVSRAGRQKREGEIKELPKFKIIEKHKRKLEGWVTFSIRHCSVKLALPSGFYTPSETELHKS